MVRPVNQSIFLIVTTQPSDMKSTRDRKFRAITMTYAVYIISGCFYRWSTYETPDTIRYGIFINNFIAQFQLSTSVKELWKSVNI